MEAKEGTRDSTSLHSAVDPKSKMVNEGMTNRGDDKDLKESRQHSTKPKVTSSNRGESIRGTGSNEKRDRQSWDRNGEDRGYSSKRTDHRNYDSKRAPGIWTNYANRGNFRGRGRPFIKNIRGRGGAYEQHKPRDSFKDFKWHQDRDFLPDRLRSPRRRSRSPRYPRRSRSYSRGRSRSYSRDRSDSYSRRRSRSRSYSRRRSKSRSYSRQRSRSYSRGRTRSSSSSLSSSSRNSRSPIAHQPVAARDLPIFPDVDDNVRQRRSPSMDSAVNSDTESSKPLLTVGDLKDIEDEDEFLYGGTTESKPQPPVSLHKAPRAKKKADVTGLSALQNYNEPDDVYLQRLQPRHSPPPRRRSPRQRSPYRRSPYMSPHRSPYRRSPGSPYRRSSRSPMRSPYRHSPSYQMSPDRSYSRSPRRSPYRSPPRQGRSPQRGQEMADKKKDIMNDPTIESILKSIGFNFELSKIMQEKAKAKAGSAEPHPKPSPKDEVLNKQTRTYEERARIYREEQELSPPQRKPSPPPAPTSPYINRNDPFSYEMREFEAMEAVQETADHRLILSEPSRKGIHPSLLPPSSYSGPPPPDLPLHGMPRPPPGMPRPPPGMSRPPPGMVQPPPPGMSRPPPSMVQPPPPGVSSHPHPPDMSRPPPDSHTTFPIVSQAQYGELPPQSRWEKSSRWQGSPPRYQRHSCSRSPSPSYSRRSESPPRYSRRSPVNSPRRQISRSSTDRGRRSPPPRSPRRQSPPPRSPRRQSPPSRSPRRHRRHSSSISEEADEQCERRVIICTDKSQPEDVEKQYRANRDKLSGLILEKEGLIKFLNVAHHKLKVNKDTRLKRKYEECRIDLNRVRQEIRQVKYTVHGGGSSSVEEPVPVVEKKSPPKEVKRPKFQEVKKEKVKPKLKKMAIHYEYLDAGNHWCRQCNYITANMHEWLLHLRSKKHIQMQDPYDRPWMPEPIKRTKIRGQNVVTSITGLEFLMASDAFYCSLCKSFAGDIMCAELHLKSEEHNEAYRVYVEENPSYEKRKNLEKAAGLSKLKSKDAPNAPIVQEREEETEDAVNLLRDDQESYMREKERLKELRKLKDEEEQIIREKRKSDFEKILAEKRRRYEDATSSKEQPVKKEPSSATKYIIGKMPNRKVELKEVEEDKKGAISIRLGSNKTNKRTVANILESKVPQQKPPVMTKGQLLERSQALLNAVRKRKAVTEQKNKQDEEVLDYEASVDKFVQQQDDKTKAKAKAVVAAAAAAIKAKQIAESVTLPSDIPLPEVSKNTVEDDAGSDMMLDSEEDDNVNEQKADLALLGIDPESEELKVMGRPPPKVQHQTSPGAAAMASASVAHLGSIFYGAKPNGEDNKSASTEDAVLLEDDTGMGSDFEMLDECDN